MYHGVAVAALGAVTTLAAACSSASTPDPAAPTQTSSSATRSTTTTPTTRPSKHPVVAHLVLRAGVATPDPRFSPGSALPGVTRAQVCSRTWNAKHKSISFEVQNDVSALYRVLGGPGTSVHFDQVIPASLGGDSTARNVWPQPLGGRQPGWAAKNLLESHLHQLVCSGQVALSTAQQAIASDWPAAQRAYLRVPVAGIR